jgi:hypothetical protein
LLTSCGEKNSLFIFFIDLDCEVGTAQFALHASDAGFGANDLGDETLHFKDPGRTEFDADAASLAVILDNFHSRGAHSRLLLFLE